MKLKQNVSLLLNLLIAIFQIYALVNVFLVKGFSSLQYYTIDSNIFACLSSIFLVVTLLIKNKTPAWVHRFRFYATSCIAVTFIVVLLILTPLTGFNRIPELFFQGTSLWLHTVCPLLSIISFLFFEKEIKLSPEQSLLALIPTFIYAIVALILNIARTITGPYIFLLVYEQSIWMTFLWIIIIGGIAYILAELLRRGNSRLGVNSSNVST